MEATPTLAPPTATIMPSVTATTTLTVTATPSQVINFKSTPVMVQTQAGRDKTIWVVAIIVLAVIGAGIFASLGSGNEPAKGG